MRFYDNIPIYIQIANDIKEKIIREQLRENDKLPSIRESCVIYEVTSLTMQRAIQQLEADGVIQSKKGVGSFIMEGSRQLLQKEMVNSQITEFITRMRSMGISKDSIITLLKEALENE